MYVLAGHHLVQGTEDGKRRHTGQTLAIAGCSCRGAIRLLIETGATEELQKIVKHQPCELWIIAHQMPILHQMLIVRQRLLQHLGAHQLGVMLGQCHQSLKYTGLGTRHIAELQCQQTVLHYIGYGMEQLGALLLYKELEHDTGSNGRALFRIT